MHTDQTISFSEEDLLVFGAASGDQNPLHLSPGYASRTAYGQQVVFGVLGCIASLRSLRRSSGTVKRVVADFQRPMFLRVDYRLETTASREGIVSRLFDGSVPVLTTSVQLSNETGPQFEMTGDPTFPLQTPRIVQWEDLQIGQETSGVYRSNSMALQKLYERWGLDLDPFVVEALLWCSYFVGMELPGQNALFFRASLNFEKPSNCDTERHFKGTISSLNAAIGQVRTNIELSSGETRVITGQLTSFVRPAMPPLRLGKDQDQQSGRLAGKVAVVLGASRGLGAALAMVLASEGAQVIAVARSAADWIGDLPVDVQKQITSCQADVQNSDSLGELGELVDRRFGRLDYAFFSAFPAIPSLRLEPTAKDRIAEYLNRATDLVLGPLCQLIPHLRRCNGCAILISSTAVEHPVRDWPHYVAAKAAAESFFRVAPLQFPEISTVLVRSQRLLTEMTNTPMGRQGASSPLDVARQISKRLTETGKLGACFLLDLEHASDSEAKNVVFNAEARELVSG